MHEAVFANRVQDVPRSFIREILKFTAEKDVISFAGGLPNKNIFPVAELKAAAQKAFDLNGADMLQYSVSEGYLPLRKYIASTYKLRFNLTVNPERIIVLNGSQQGLDLIGKALLNEKDDVIIEEPGYLGAIQALSLFQPTFRPVPLNNTGIRVDLLEKCIREHKPKLFYSVPNFQNPSGISYSEEVRRDTAKLIANSDTFIVEDDPYGELRYSGAEKSSFANYIPEKTILLGSFSKTIVPGFRLGWIVLPDSLFEKVLITKQASDLHSNQLAQHIIYQYITDNNLSDHTAKIKAIYGKQCEVMTHAIAHHFPDDIAYTKPEGGMFLWLTLPKGVSSMELFHEAIKKKVAFVPGDPFYINKSNVNTLRLNFSCTPPDVIEDGITRLSSLVKFRV